MLCSRVQKFSFCSGVIIPLHRCWPRFAGRSCQYQVCFSPGRGTTSSWLCHVRQQHSELWCSLADDGFLKKISLNGHMLRCKLWQLFEENAPRLWETSNSWQLLSKVISLPWKLWRQTSHCWEKRQSMPPSPAGEEVCPPGSCCLAGLVLISSISSCSKPVLVLQEGLESQRASCAWQGKVGLRNAC